MKAAWLVSGVLAAVLPIGAALNDHVLVLYSKNSPDSRRVAEHYRDVRSIPSAQVVGLDIDPSLAGADRVDSWVWDDVLHPQLRKLLDANSGRFRTAAWYIVPVWGIPMLVTLNGAGDTSIDGLIASINFNTPNFPNPFTNGTFATYAAAKDAAGAPRIYLVTRLAGTTPDMSLRLIDDALAAEQTLRAASGTAYFDVYPNWPQDFEQSAAIAQQSGLNVVVNRQGDNRPGLQPSELNNVLIYWGGYLGHQLLPNLKTGSFAALLTSYSLNRLHPFDPSAPVSDPARRWNLWTGGAYLEQGAACTFGPVNEPGFFTAAGFFQAWLREGLTFGEAFTRGVVRTFPWVMTAIGDPLYAPAGIQKLTSAGTLTYTLPLNASPPLTAPIRIKCGGGPVSDSNGQKWLADAYFSGGNTDATSASIAGTSDAALYQSERVGMSSYAVPVANGRYTVNLKFAELYFSDAGKRVFGVSINGEKVLSGFDIVAQAGGARIAADRQFQVTVTGGIMTIQFTPVVDNPAISAIEILAGRRRGRIRPLDSQRPEPLHP